MFVLKLYDYSDFEIFRLCLIDIFLMVLKKGKLKLKKGNELRKMRKLLNYFKIPALKSNPISEKIQDEHESFDTPFADINSCVSKFQKR